jgi:hypothetical protein
MSGKWIRLEDGRVKMDFNILGTTTTILLRVKVKGDTLECIDQKGGVNILKRQSESMLPKAQAGDKSATLPADLVNFINAYYTKLPAFPTRLWADCKRYTCKDLEINCGKSIPINRGDKLNGVTARYIVVYSFITNMDGRNIEVVEQNSFQQKGNTWSYGMPSRSMETSESQCSQLSY